MKAVMNKKLKAFFGAIKLESMHDIFIERINEKWKNKWKGIERKERKIKKNQFQSS